MLNLYHYPSRSNANVMRIAHYNSSEEVRRLSSLSRLRRSDSSYYFIPPGLLSSMHPLFVLCLRNGNRQILPFTQFTWSVFRMTILNHPSRWELWNIETLSNTVREKGRSTVEHTLLYFQFSIRTEDTMLSVSFLIQFIINLAIVICYVSILLGVRSTTAKKNSVSLWCDNGIEEYVTLASPT